MSSRIKSIPLFQDLQPVRDLVMAYGWNATAYQIINPGFLHWFAAAQDAVVGYVEHAKVRVVAGAPVCTRARLSEVVAEFESDTTRVGSRVCYFGAEARLESVLGNSLRHSKLQLGAQPAWHPCQWPAIYNHHASLRAQLNRARNKGVTIKEWTAEESYGHTALNRCLDEWLATRGLPPMHFLVEPQTLERLFDRRIFVAERQGKAIGFLVASPVPQRNGWLIEQTIRGTGAVNGMIELLIDTAVRSMAESASDYVTLGLSPLSLHCIANSTDSSFWLRAVLTWLRLHGRRFYNFDGLDRFKAKFQPERWEPVFAIANEPRFSPRSLYAIAAAFTAGAPFIAISQAVWRAVIGELNGLINRRAQAQVRGLRRTFFISL
ncbi:MAG: DUF2156 domain-containing protein [Blastocatellia bacterium]